jgi:hypothetical protein
MTSGYLWPSDTVKSPGFFKPRERHTKVQSSFFFFFFFFGLKSPPWKHTRTVGIRECRAGPGRLSVTDPSSVTDVRSEFIDRLTQFLLVFLSLGQSKHLRMQPKTSCKNLEIRSEEQSCKAPEIKTLPKLT